MEKHNLIVMIGLPASGKSTKADEIDRYFEEKGEGGATIYSSDALRKKLFGNENDQEHNNAVFKVLYEELIYGLAAGHVVIDATNVTLKNRRRIFETIRQYRNKINVIAYVMTTPIENCIQRDSERDRKVGEEVIRKFASSYQFPQLFEGFDQIIVDGYYPDVPKFDPFRSDEILNLMKGFDQKTPYHKFDVYEHCCRVMCQASDYNNSNILKTAGMFHDIGKVFTQKIDEEGKAHYYSHDSIGTYFLLNNLEIFNFQTWEEIYECLFYINYHMRAPRDFKSPKAERKYRNIFGDKLFDNLMKFAEWDVIASGVDKDEVKKNECKM